MKVIDGKLCNNAGTPVPFRQAFDTRGPFSAPPKVLVLHYDAMRSQSEAVSALTRNDKNYISAHLSLSREGDWVQMASLGEVTLHAGDGTLAAVRPYGTYSWGGVGRSTLNATAIGIEINNLGWLDRRRGELWTRQEQELVVGWPAADCIVDVHPHRGGAKMGWPRYPDEQIAALDKGIAAILAAFPSIERIVGHDEVSKQKYDPGPAFPLDAVRRRFEKRGVAP